MNTFLRAAIFRCIFSFLLFLHFLVGAVPAFCQVKFSAVCPNKQIGKNEYLQLQYLVENASDVEQIVPPSFKNFVIVSGPNQQSGMSSVNGNVKRYIAVEFILKPITTGNFTFSPATAKVGGHLLYSNSLSVKVTNKSPGGSSGGSSLSPFANVFSDVLPVEKTHQYDDYILRKGDNIEDKIKKNLFVSLVVSKNTCYVGEPIVATYKLYTRLKSQSNLTKSPSFNGFSVSEMDMPDNYTLATEKFNGREYSVYILRKVQLYPLQSGTFELEPIEVENDITFLKSDYANERAGDIFDDMLRDFAGANSPADAIEEKKVTLQSKPLSIVVKPLPEQDQPKDFKGAVGNFNFDAVVSKNKMTTDEAGYLTLSVSGTGNIQMINAPAISWPDGMEAFEPKLSENLDKTNAPLKGKKSFNFPFTVSKHGIYIIPPITFSYFDLSTQSYKTISTKPINIEAKRGNLLRQLIPKNKNKFIDEPESFYDMVSRLRWAIIISLIILAVFIVLIRKFLSSRNKKTLIPAEEKSDHVLQKEISAEELNKILIGENPLLEASRTLENNASYFYHALNNCLRKYLANKLQSPEKELSKRKISELLDKHNVSVGTTLLLTSLLETIELNLYAPPSSSYQMQEVYDRANEVIALLDKQVTNFQ